MMNVQKTGEKKPVVKKVEFDLSDLKKELRGEMKAELELLKKEQTSSLAEFQKELEKLSSLQNAVPRHNHPEYALKGELERWAQAFVELKDTVNSLVAEFNKLVESFHR